MGYQDQGNVFVQLFAAVFKGLKNIIPLFFLFGCHFVSRSLLYDIVRIGMFIYKHEYIKFGHVILSWCFLRIRFGCKHNLPIW